MPGIVVGVDGSGHSQRALDWAMREAAIRHAPLTVVTVHQLVRGYTGTGVPYANDIQLAEQAGKQAKQEADEILAELGDARPESVTVQALSGIPAEELLRVAWDADLIVMGSRGAGGFAKLLMGSVSAQVAQHARCPVVIVPSVHD
jgi:nucleotide-binding universal stress UspA family protein